MLRYFCFLAAILEVRLASAAYVKPCKPEDSACIVSQAQAFIPVFAAGIPELGVPALDPMRLALVKSEEVGIKLTFKDTTVTGLQDCTIEDIRLALQSSKGKLDVRVRCSVVLRGLYKLRGTILVIPIRGEGKETIKIRDILITANSTLSTVTGSDGQQHWHINKWKHSYDVLTKTSFRFGNLFDGNKDLADPVIMVLNQQWKVVMTEIAPPIVYAIVDRVVQAVGAFFAAVPAAELYVA